MKKIISVLLFSLLSFFGYSQLNEGFESGIPATWAVFDNGIGTTQSWSTTSVAINVYAGTSSAEVLRGNIGNGNTSEDWLVTPIQNIPVNGQLRFFTRSQLTGDNGTKYQIRISSINAPSQTDPTTFTVIKEYTELELSAIANVYQEQLISLAAYPNQNRYIAFVRVHNQIGTATTGDKWLLDDVKLVVQCVDPTVLTATNITATTALLNWTSTAPLFDIEYGLSGFTFGTGTRINGVPKPYLLTGLLSASNYQFYVRAICSSGTNAVTSNWTDLPSNFRTKPFGSVCSGPIVVTTLPYQVAADNTSNYGDNADVAQGNLCGAVPAGTNYMAGDDVFYSYTPTTTGLISVTMTPQGAASTNSSLFIYSGCANVGVSCVTGVANTGTAVRTVTFIATAGVPYIVVISSSTTQSIGYSLLIQEEACTPKPISLTTGSITTTTASLSWTNPGFTSWQVAVQPVGAAIPTGAGEPASNPFVKTGLTAGTFYQYWVRSECTAGSGIFSAWAGPFPFNTIVCEAADKCVHNFILTSTGTNGWGTVANGTRMQIKQNGILVTEIGATFTTGAGPFTIPVSLCKNVPFELFWNTAGNAPARCGLTIQNSFGQTIYTKLPGTGAPLTVLTTYTVNCDAPVCNIAPVNVALVGSSLTTSGATVSWTSPAMTAWEIYIVAAGSPAPTIATVPTFTGVNVTSPYVFSGLLADTSYTVYVRVPCSPDASDWSVPVTFTTIATCFKPTSFALSIPSITTTTASVSWLNGNATDTHWEILAIPAIQGPIGPLAPAAPGISPVLTGGTLLFDVTTASPFVLTGLAPATIYYYYIRTVCSSSDSSTWAPGAPAFFNTVTCAVADQCTYKFVLTNTATPSWNGGRMQVRQNGILVATLGATLINNPAGVAVPLCPGVPFDLFWSIAGTIPDGIGVSIQNPFLDVLYTKAPATGTPLIVLFSGTGNCTPAACSKPTTMLAVPSATSALLSWTDVSIPTAANYALYIVPTGGAAPINVPPTAPTLTPVTNPFDISVTTGFTLTPSTSYTYYVKSLCSPTESSSWTVLTPTTFVTKPLNDECTTATPVTINSGQTCLPANNATGNTLGATASNPVLTVPLTGVGCGATNNDVWYSFVAGAVSQTISLNNLVATPASATLNHSVFSGTCTDLTKLYCSSLLISTATGLIPGNTYFIRVYNATTTANQFITFNLCITSPPVNDECVNALPVVVNTGQTCVPANNTLGNTFGASASNPILTTPLTGVGCGATNNDVWYRFVAIATSQTISLSNLVATPAAATLNYSVFSGPCNDLTKLYCSTSLISTATGLTIGNTYYIRVYNSTTTANQFISFNLCITSPPANDICTGAVNVPINPDQVCTQFVSGSTIGATTSLPTITGTGCGTTDDDVWYSFVATNNIHIINLSNIIGAPTSVTLNHAVFSGPCDALLNRYCSTAPESVATGLVIGQTYFVRIYTSGSTAGQFATFDLCIKTPPPPATNNECADAISIRVNLNAICSYTTPGNIIGATASLPTPPAPCVGNANDDVWFSFVATSAIHYISLLNVAGTTTDLNHAVYTGNCGALTQKYCSAAGSLLSNNATFVIGQRYYIRVWSNSAASQVTTFDICVKSISTCENAAPFCGADSSHPYVFSNTTGILSTGQIACLGSNPNPTYYTLHVGQTGNLAFNIFQNTIIDPVTGVSSGNNLDVDFVAWGPFASAAACSQISFTDCPTCPFDNFPPTNSTFYPLGNIIDCSYSTSNTETLTIPNAVAGQFYVILITNFIGTPGFIKLVQTNFGNTGSGETICCSAGLGADKVVCGSSVLLNALDSPADPANVPSTFQWFYNGSTVAIPGENGPTYLATQAGIYKVKGACGLNTVFDEITVTFNVTPSPVITTVQPTCTVPTGAITVTSPLNIGTGGTPRPNLFISEVTDAAAGQLTYVELFNGTGAAVNLSDYKLKVFNFGTNPSNPVTLSCDLNLSGTIANNATFVIQLSSASNVLAFTPDLIFPGCGGVNTNDYIKLTTSADVAIDLWGATDGISYTPLNQTGYDYRRNVTATAPSLTWNPAEWTAIDPEVYSGVGNYPPNVVVQYQYSIDGVNYQIDPHFSPIPTGSYNVTVKDVVTGCISTITVGAINPSLLAPAAPTSPTGNQSVCVTSPIQTLTPDAVAPALATYNWYDAATGGNLIANPTLSTVGNVTYYAESVLNGCVSNVRTAVRLEIKPNPTAPITGATQSVCAISPLQTLTASATATGASLVWYTSLTGGTVVTNPTLNTINTIIYYAESVANGCSSTTRTLVSLEIKPNPLAPTTTMASQVACAQSPIQTLTATATPPTGASVVWYTTSTAGTIVANPTLSMVNTVSFYAQSALNGCVSQTRTAVSLQIKAVPAAPSGSSQSVCSATPIQTLIAAATVPAGASLVWYSALSGGTVVTNPSLNTVGTATYYAESAAIGCGSATRTPILLEIKQTPVAPTTAAVAQSECALNPIQTLTAVATATSGVAVVWYAAATGGIALAAPTLNAVATVTYFAESALAGCLSTTRTPVSLEIKAIPSAPSTGNQSECAATPIQTLTAVAAPQTANVVWYAIASGGVAVISPSINSIGSTTYFAESELNGCNSTSRATAVLTINTTPEIGLQGGCEGLNFLLHAIAINGFNPASVSYAWTNSLGQTVGGNAQTITVTATGKYYCVVTLNGCASSKEEFDVNATSCTIQRGISPRGTGIGDGLNDFFDLATFNVTNLEIYNRYGAKVYAKTNYKNEWYGQSDSGNELPDGTYYYVIMRDNVESKTGWIYINHEK